MSDHDPPGNADSPNDDMWARLRRLEDLERRPVPATPATPRPRPDQPPVAPAPPTAGPGPAGPAAGPDHTTVMPTPVPGPAAGAAPGPAAGAGPQQYYVPAAGAAPSPQARVKAEQQYRAAAAPPTAAATEAAPKRAKAPKPAPSGRGPSRLRPKAKWFRPKLRWLFLYLPLLIMLLIGGIGLWGWSTFNDLYRVDLGDAIVPATGDAVNYLIVGSDSRDGIEGDTPNVGAIGTGTEVKGRRSDTIIVLRVEGDKAQMMSIPRDLWVTNVKTGKKGRINGTYAQGPDNLVRSVTANLGIPINRYIEVDFVSFAGMVDAVGGIDIDFAHPATDTNSGLKIPTAGVNRLDGTMALVYVRSRHFTEEIDGKQVLEPTADIGRQVRQQNFIRTVLRTVGENRNPLTLAKVGSAAAKGVRVDSEVGFVDLVKLARQLGGADPETIVLPTVGANKGGASVLELQNAAALPILAQFGATG